VGLRLYTVLARLPKSCGMGAGYETFSDARTIHSKVVQIDNWWRGSEERK